MRTLNSFRTFDKFAGFRCIVNQFQPGLELLSMWFTDRGYNRFAHNTYRFGYQYKINQCDRRAVCDWCIVFDLLVGHIGFEPMIFRLWAECFNQLSQCPKIGDTGGNISPKWTWLKHSDCLSVVPLTGLEPVWISPRDFRTTLCHHSHTKVCCSLDFVFTISFRT